MQGSLHATVLLAALAACSTGTVAIRRDRLAALFEEHSPEFYFLRPDALTCKTYAEQEKCK